MARRKRRRPTKRFFITIAVLACLVDTPGFSLMELPLMEPESLCSLYPEFDAYQNQCRFDGCLHHAEPDCAVKQAVAQGKLDEPRYQRYLQILQQVQEKWRKRYE